MKISKILFCLLTCISFWGFSQKRELGASFGAMHYKGDITPRFRPFAAKTGASLFFRYNANRVFSYKINLLAGQIAGSDRKTTDQFQQERNYSFKSSISELSTQAEYNFLNFRQGFSNFRQNWTPYIFGGLGYYQFNPDLQTSDYKKKGLAIPFGIGFKSVWRGPWNIGLEFGTRKTGTDYLDDLGQRDTNIKLQQGNPTTKDMYYFTNFSISYTFYKIACPK